MLRDWAISLRFFPILKKAELAYAMRSAWLHLALTALLTLGITIWSRSAKAMVQALIASCSSLLNTFFFAANQPSASCTLCCCSSSTACDIGSKFLFKFLHRVLKYCHIFPDFVTQKTYIS